MNSTTNTPITTLHQHLVQLSAGLRLPPVAAALQEAGLAHLPVGVVVAVEEARARQVAAGEAGKGQGARGAEGGRGNEKQKNPPVQKPPPVHNAPKGVSVLEASPKQTDENRARSQAAQATGAGQRATTSMIAVKKAASAHGSTTKPRQSYLRSSSTGRAAPTDTRSTATLTAP